MEAGSNANGIRVPQEPRRRKTVWQAWQKKALLSAFATNQYPSFRDRQELARQIELPESRVRVWFQNRRSRTGELRHAPNRSSRGPSLPPSQQLQEGFGSRTQRRSMPSDRRRPRTRLNLEQRRILVQAFETNPLPGFATREELGQRTGLPEDTIHIWFQNRRARQPRAQDQDVPASQVQAVAAGGLGGRDPEAAQDTLLALSATGGAGMENSSSSDQPNFYKGSQQPQVAQPEGPGQAETATRASSTGPPELRLDQLLEEDQVEDQEPVPVDLDGSSRGQGPERVQETFLQLAAQDRVAMETSSSSDPSTFCRESQLPQWAQPEGPGQAQPLTPASNTGPLELFLDQLLMEVQGETHGPGPVHLEGAGQQMDTTAELPLTQEEYEALLDIL